MSEVCDILSSQITENAPSESKLSRQPTQQQVDVMKVEHTITRIGTSYQAQMPGISKCHHTKQPMNTRFLKLKLHDSKSPIDSVRFQYIFKLLKRKLGRIINNLDDFHTLLQRTNYDYDLIEELIIHDLAFLKTYFTKRSQINVLKD